MSRPKPPIDPRELLEQSLRLISQELDFLEEASKQRKLENDEAASLVKYSDALLKHLHKNSEEEVEEKRKLSKMSTAELAAKAEELAQAARVKSAKT